MQQLAVPDQKWSAADQVQLYWGLARAASTIASFPLAIDLCQKAAQLGAELWVRRASQPPWELDGDADDFCQWVMDQVTVQSGRALVAAALAETHGLEMTGHGLWRRLFVDQALPLVRDVAVATRTSASCARR